MDIFLKNRLVAWFYVLMIILNLSTLITIWYIQINKPVPGQPPGTNQTENVQQFLNRELALTPEQKQRFREARERYFEESRRKLEDIQLLSIDLLRESFSPSPDSMKAKELARVIGDKQEKFELLTYYQFRDLYFICQPDQQMRFNALLSEIVEITRPGNVPRDKRYPPPPGERTPKH
jgi:Spy/CpxP family protein refolding chaperone